MQAGVHMPPAAGMQDLQERGRRAGLLQAGSACTGLAASGKAQQHACYHDHASSSALTSTVRILMSPPAAMRACPVTLCPMAWVS